MRSTGHTLTAEVDGAMERTEAATIAAIHGRCEGGGVLLSAVHDPESREVAARYLSARNRG